MLSLALPFSTNKPSDTLNSVVRYCLDYGVSQWAWPSSVSHIRSQNKTTSPLLLRQPLMDEECDWVQPDGFSLMFERRKNKKTECELRKGHLRIKYWMHVRLFGDKTKFESVKKNILLVITPGQMLNHKIEKCIWIALTFDLRKARVLFITMWRSYLWIISILFHLIVCKNCYLVTLLTVFK